MLWLDVFYKLLRCNDLQREVEATREAEIAEAPVVAGETAVSGLAIGAIQSNYATDRTGCGVHIEREDQG